MAQEFQQVKDIFTHQICLSPFDSEKRINIATDGANSSGVGFVLFQNTDDLKQGDTPLIHVYTDCISLEGIFDKPLGDFKNWRIRDMVEKLMGYNFKFHYVPAEENKILDCFSRLIREI